MWRNVKFGEVFRCRDILDVEKFQMSQNLFRCNSRCSVAKHVLSWFTLFLCGEKLNPKFCPRRKNNKYNVCIIVIIIIVIVNVIITIRCVAVGTPEGYSLYSLNSTDVLDPVYKSGEFFIHHPFMVFVDNQC